MEQLITAIVIVGFSLLIPFLGYKLGEYLYKKHKEDEEERKD